MIEAGVAGGSAAAQAVQRRATADRLVAEAQWLEALAADEKGVASHLAKLPLPYALLHDLKLPGSKGNIDHLVVGPGGAFVVVTRRCAEAVDYRDGQLFAGDLSLRDLLDAARVESQLLTQSLGTPVVPVVTIVGAVLPASLPPAIDGVLVCAVENVVRVVTRASHTQTPPDHVKAVIDRAMPLLHDRRSAVRTEASAGARAEQAPEMTPKSSAPPGLAPSGGPAKRREESDNAMRRAQNTGTVAATPPAPAEPAQQVPDTPVARASAPARQTGKERSGKSRSARFVVGAILLLCLIAIGVGTLGRALWSDDDADGGTPSTEPGDSVDDTLPDTTAGTTSLADGLAAPVVAFSPVCPTVGGGWQLQPVWPGDLTGLTEYEIELQNLDGTWLPLAPLPTAVTPWGSLTSQPPATTLVIRITALMSDGSRSINQPTDVVTPATAC